MRPLQKYARHKQRNGAVAGRLQRRYASGVTNYGVLIVGAGHGGAQAAILLRQFGFSASIGLAGAEPDLPYERPPLSKDYLAGKKAFERMLIRPAPFWAERDIGLLPNSRIASIDTTVRQARTTSGSNIAFDKLIWAAGGVPRRLACPGHDLEGVHVIRCREEVDAIRAELASACRVAIIGGGYIGLEAAAVLGSLGKDVVIVEAQDRPLARVSGREISDFFEAEHRARGVDLRLSETVTSIEGRHGRASAVRLESGERIETDLVIVGIGIAPNVAPLLDAGAAEGNGVRVDQYCRTSLPGVYAIGDCAEHENVFAGGAPVRIESVQNAHDQAATAVKAILGAPEPYRSVPWFWSNQYDLRLQTVGLSIGHDATVLRGDPAARSFSLVYLRQGRVVALDCVNATRDYAQGRKLVAEGASPDPSALADPSIPLKTLAAAGEQQ